MRKFNLVVDFIDGARMMRARVFLANASSQPTAEIGYRWVDKQAEIMRYANVGR